MAAVDRTATTDDRAVSLASDEAMRPEATGLIGWPFIPDIPIGYLIAAAVLLCGVFFGGLVLSAAAREAKALAEARRNAGRWVYRMAS
jgi:hypothetical protein